MTDVFPKFIIETDDELGDCLIIARCTFHKQLVTDEKKVKGGGWWRKENDTFILFGCSTDFGAATIENIKSCIDKKNVFTNSGLYCSIADEFSFSYDTRTEIINLK